MKTLEEYNLHDPLTNYKINQLWKTAKEEKKMSEQKEKIKPFFKGKYVTVFKKNVTLDDGNTIHRYNHVIQTAYKTPEGEWVNSSNFSEIQALRLIFELQSAEYAIRMDKQGEN